MTKDLQQLITSPDTASLLFDEMPRFMYFMKDRQLRFIKVNQQLADRIGKPICEILGKTDFDMLPRPMAEAYLKDDQAIIDSGKPLSKKVELVPGRCGQVEWSVTTKVPIFNTSNEVIAIAAVTRPFSSSETALHSSTELTDAIRHIHANSADKLTVGELAKMSSLSVSAFERKFKRLFHITPIQYIRNTRIQVASQQLLQTNNTIATIATHCGFYDQSHFSKDFSNLMNMTPSKFRKLYRI